MPTLTATQSTRRTTRSQILDMRVQSGKAQSLLLNCRCRCKDMTTNGGINRIYC